jgi:5-methylcytosine-specific restriction protein A
MVSQTQGPVEIGTNAGQYLNKTAATPRPQTSITSRKPLEPELSSTLNRGVRRDNRDAYRVNKFWKTTMAPSTVRAFRTPESLDEERKTKNAVRGFLESRGFQDIEDHRKVMGQAISQTIAATTPSGAKVKMRVRVCWRPRKSEQRFVAAQLRARLVDGDWDKTLRSIEDGERKDGATHTLFVNRVGEAITHAVLVPRDQLPQIWRRQRDVSAALIKDGAMGRIRKNHAQNGSSPTIWLEDTRAPRAHAVPDVLWGWPGVLNLVELQPFAPTSIDDTYDDCPGLSLSDFGSDGAPKREVIRSQVKRDPKVRAAVLKRAAGKCERKECGLSRGYIGFLDVHHILGVEKSDRIWTCVALCPNCHRDAHAAAESERINEALLSYASQFQA